MDCNWASAASGPERWSQSHTILLNIAANIGKVYEKRYIIKSMLSPWYENVLVWQKEHVANLVSDTDFSSSHRPIETGEVKYKKAYHLIIEKLNKIMSKFHLDLQ